MAARDQAQGSFKRWTVEGILTRVACAASVFHFAIELRGRGVNYGVASGVSQDAIDCQRAQEMADLFLEA